MSKKYRISLIGSGKVAWQLAQALENAGHFIEEIWSRQPAHAAQLVDHLYAARVHESLDFSESLAEIFLLAVADSAAEGVVNELMLPPGALLAHTSGTLPMEILEPAAASYGVFYPLQTFSKEKKPDLSEVPFCLEASHKKGLKRLKKLANSLSSKLYELNGDKRKVLHLAAVFACNFTNHMLRISEDILQQEGLDTGLLHPLIIETMDKSMQMGPAQSQTGPAARGDQPVLEAHLELLEDRPQWAELYYLLSQDIMRYYTR